MLRCIAVLAVVRDGAEDGRQVEIDEACGHEQFAWVYMAGIAAALRAAEATAMLLLVPEKGLMSLRTSLEWP